MTFDQFPNSYIQSEKGSTLFVHKNHNIISLKTGQFFIGGGNVPLHFQAPGLNIVLPPKALALVTVKRNQESRIVVLDSGKTKNGLVNVAYEQYATSLHPGDNLVVVPHTTAGSSRSGKKISMANERVENLHYTATKSTGNVRTTVRMNVLLNCVSVNLPYTWPYQQLEQHYGVKFAGRQKFTSQLQQKDLIKIPAQIAKPVVYVQPNIPDVWMSPHAVVVPINDGHYFIASGSILVHAKTPILVDTPNGSITLKPNCVALISSQATMTRIFDLYDHHRDSITAVAGETSMKLMPGSEVALIEGNESDINRVILKDDIGHKDMRIVRASNGRGMVSGDFSMNDMLSYQPLLEQLNKSPDKLDKVLFHSLMKTAVIRSDM
jgi:hypothetical protein